MNFKSIAGQLLIVAGGAGGAVNGYYAPSNTNNGVTGYYG